MKDILTEITLLNDRGWIMEQPLVSTPEINSGTGDCTGNCNDCKKCDNGEMYDRIPNISE